MEHILQFTTGVDEEPVLGFSLHPQIVFAEVFGGNFLPRAKTCTNCLAIPRGTLTTPLLQVQELHNLYDYAFASAFFGMIRICRTEYFVLAFDNAIYVFVFCFFGRSYCISTLYF